MIPKGLPGDGNILVFDNGGWARVGDVGNLQKLATIEETPTNGQIVGDFLLQNMLAMFALQSSTANIRLRLYRTINSREADKLRGIDELPYDSQGLVLDMIVPSANTVTPINPIVVMASEQREIGTGKIYFTIDNLSGNPISPFFLTTFYFALEIESRIPQGYLPRHYRFFRDNSTATKRRNFLGCKNTIDTTIDGLPPIQVFIGEGTDVVVAPTQTNEEIITGGGGTLDVS
jgi:hypothetical protein